MATLYADVSQNTQGEYPSALYTTGRLHVCYGKFTIAAAGTHELELPRLLPGKVMILSPLCWVSMPQGVSTADAHLGYRAFINTAGATVVADDNYWIDNADVGGGALQGLVPAITGVTTAGAKPVVLDAQDGLRVFVLIDTANTDAADVWEVAIVYAHVN